MTAFANKYQQLAAFATKRMAQGDSVAFHPPSTQMW